MHLAPPPPCAPHWHNRQVLRRHVAFVHPGGVVDGLLRWRGELALRRVPRGLWQLRAVDADAV
eukprot:1286462-Rhodomonas_salina.1